MTIMLRFPSLLETRLVPRSAALFLGDLLVSIHLFHQGRYYYGVSSGLTNESGIARITREHLIHQFVRDRDLFPMDFRIGIEECDPQVTVVVRGGQEFVKARASALGSGLTDSEARRRYEVARNELIQSRQQPVSFPEGIEELLVVSVPIELAGV